MQIIIITYLKPNYSFLTSLDPSVRDHGLGQTVCVDSA